MDVQVSHPENTSSLPSDTRRTLLLLNPRLLERLSKVELDFGVDEVLEPFEHHAPVFVGNDVEDVHRFVVHLNPD